MHLSTHFEKENESNKAAFHLFRKLINGSERRVIFSKHFEVNFARSGNPCGNKGKHVSLQRSSACLSASLIYWQVHRQEAWDEIFLKSSHDLDSQLCLPGAASAHNLIGRWSSLMVHVEIGSPDTIAAALKEKKKRETGSGIRQQLTPGYLKILLGSRLGEKKLSGFPTTLLSWAFLLLLYPHQKKSFESTHWSWRRGRRRKNG